MSPAASSRWCPTPEQLMILEEIYRTGIRTPNSSQIQQITAHLSSYGKIEGKNVFYWFQNHKARDRQKLRRKLSKQLQQQQLYHHQFQQNQQNRRLLRCFESPGSALQQFSCYNSASFLPQGGVLEDAPRQMMNHTWKVDIPDRVEMETSKMRTYDHDWMMMVDVGPPSQCCTRPTLKTLELFPITATNLKEECNNRSKSLSCTTSINKTLVHGSL